MRADIREIDEAVDGSDPHQSYSPNRNVQMQVYESLTFQNENLLPVPGLAETWRVVDDNTWEFRLRPTPWLVMTPKKAA